MICIDCGYIVPSGFNDLPRNYKCPQCLVGKNRFKPNESSTAYYNSLASQKAANKAAFRAKRAAARSGKGEEKGSKRERMKAKMLEAQAEKDSQRKKKGFFGF